MYNVPRLAMIFMARVEQIKGRKVNENQERAQKIRDNKNMVASQNRAIRQIKRTDQTI
jgi:hypothetical protein